MFSTFSRLEVIAPIVVTAVLLLTAFALRRFKRHRVAEWIGVAVAGVTLGWWMWQAGTPLIVQVGALAAFLLGYLLPTVLRAFYR
jgi:uncharacterized membrane protein YGL010W